jgi:hypothetical protein
MYCFRIREFDPDVEPGGGVFSRNSGKNGRPVLHAAETELPIVFQGSKRRVGGGGAG